MTKDELCFSLTRFVLEARKRNGDPYPAETLYELVISLQLHLSLNGREMRFLQDKEFVVLKNTLDTRMKELSSQGIRVRRKQDEVISEADEETLWKSVLGEDTPQKLLDTVLYLFGLHFALRVGQEHRNLRYGPESQITVQQDAAGRRFLRYTEDVSKNRQGGLKHRRVTPKSVDAYENEAYPDQCIVRLYKKYVFHRPPHCQNDAFYLRPLDNPSGDVWYARQPLGIHVISKTVGRLCQSAGITGYHTNHSLRATTASRLYQQNFDEQLISETTGHRSNAVRRYKRTTDDQHKAVSDSIQSVTPPSRPAVTCTRKAEPTATVTSETAGNDSLHVTVNINIPDTKSGNNK